MFRWLWQAAFPRGRKTTYDRWVYENGELVTDKKRADEIIAQMDKHWSEFDNRMKSFHL